MKKIVATLLMLTLFTIGGVSTSLAETYVSGNLGAVFLSDSDLDDGVDTGEFTFDTGFGITAAIGTTVAEAGRAEMEFGYRANDMDEFTVDGLGTVSIDGDVTSLSLMGNFYYDFKNESSFTPFIGAGIGFTKIEADIDTLSIGSEDDTVFAYQVMLGGGFAVADNTTLDLQYRYFATDDPEFDGLEAEYASHNLMVGLRYSF